MKTPDYLTFLIPNSESLPGGGVWICKYSGSARRVILTGYTRGPLWTLRVAERECSVS